MNNRNALIILSHPNIVRIIGDVCYDKDNKEVEPDEAVLQAYIDGNEYKEKRMEAYPSFAEQFDTLYHGGYDAWKETIKQIKDNIPKP